MVCWLSALKSFNYQNGFRVYCRYHYLEGHEFKTPEEELIHFLGKMYDMDFKWERQYEPLESEDLTKSRSKNCDQTLMVNDKQNFS